MNKTASVWKLRVDQSVTLVVEFDEPVDYMEARRRALRDEYEDVIDETDHKTSQVWEGTPLN